MVRVWGRGRKNLWILQNPVDLEKPGIFEWFSRKHGSVRLLSEWLLISAANNTHTHTLTWQQNLLQSNLQNQNIPKWGQAAPQMGLNSFSPRVIVLFFWRTLAATKKKTYWRGKRYWNKKKHTILKCKHSNERRKSTRGRVTRSASAQTSPLSWRWWDSGDDLKNAEKISRWKTKSGKLQLWPHANILMVLVVCVGSAVSRFHHETQDVLQSKVFWFSTNYNCKDVKIYK